MTSIDITAVAKLKHADLWDAVKKLGGQSALARELGVRADVLGRWVNMRGCPPSEPNDKWPLERLAALEAKLFELTGKTTEELFPAALREATEFLRSDKTFEQTASIEGAALLSYASHTTDRLSYSESDDPEKMVKAVQQAVKRLSYREREIIKLRFGLGDGYRFTYEEIAHIFKVTRERVRQLEARGLRKLREGKNSRQELIGFTGPSS